jgi:hypothetical protein
MKRLLPLALMIASASALAHPGGLDKCGGHNDKQRGGYHVHDKQKYCACNPSSGECSQRTFQYPAQKSHQPGSRNTDSGNRNR